MLLTDPNRRIPSWVRPWRPGFWVTCVGPALAVAAFVAWLYLRIPLELTRAGTRTTAALTLVSCKPVPAVRYAFDAEGRTYFGLTTPGAFGIPCQDLQVGAQVPIAYVPGDPTQSAGMAGLEQATRTGLTASGIGFLLAAVGVGSILWVCARPAILRGGGT
jgi:hypothetical protein